MSTPASPRSEAERYNEAASLAKLAPPELYRVAKQVLADTEWRVRRAGWEALLRADVDAGERVLFLLENLEDTENAGARGAALEALIHLGEAGVPFLVDALGGRSARGKRFILDVLSQIKSPAAAASARALLQDPDDNIGFAAAEVLGSTGTREDAFFLLSSVPAVHGSRQFAFMAAIVEIAKRFSVEFKLEDLAPHLADALLRGPTLELMGMAGTQEAGEALWSQVEQGRPIDNVLTALAHLQTLNTNFQVDPDAQKFAAILERCRIPGVGGAIRQSAFQVIARSHPAQLAPLVPIIAEEDSDWLADQVAKLPLGVIRNLLPAVSIGEKGRLVAAKLYHRLPELNGESALLALLNQPGEHRYEVLAALATSGGLRSIPHLLALCSAPDAAIADRAAESLYHIVGRGTRGYEDKLFSILETAPVEVVVRLLPVAGLLTEITRAIETICLFMRSSEPAVRCAAVRSAPRFAKNPDVSSLLLFRLTDEDDDVRAAASDVIGAAGLHEAVDGLRVLLEDSNPWVQASALRGLAALQEWPVPDRLLGLLRRGGVVAVTAAKLIAERKDEKDFDSLAGVVAELESDAAAELLKTLGLFERDVSPALLTQLHNHTDWSVRASVVHYIDAKRREWMIELARSWMQGEVDEWVRFRLAELVGT